MPGLKGFYSIEPGLPFADVLAAYVLKEAKAQNIALPHIRLLLPTRRAVRHMRDAFLRQSEGSSTLLPVMQAIADPDEDELLISLSTLADQNNAIPPVLPGVKRILLLAQLILKLPDFSQNIGHAVQLAKALAQWLDQVHTEGLDLNRLDTLVDNPVYARHWDITLQFLSILRQAWPALLDSYNALDPAARRNLLMEQLCNVWTSAPPQSPVIAAGITGSIPAVATLLSCITKLPKGCLILPGLDQHLDDHGWNAIDAAHPQYAIKQLLNKTDIPRTDIHTLPDHRKASAKKAVMPLPLQQRMTSLRNRFISKCMYPADITHQWRDPFLNESDRDLLQKSLDHIVRFDAPSQDQEALFIAIKFRETLEIPGRTACLITPDRMLARRVMAICRRWDITVNDSGGYSYAHTDPGRFLKLVSDVMVEDFAPSALLSLLKHSRTGLGYSPIQLQNLTYKLDYRYLRGSKPDGGIEGLLNTILEKEGAESPLYALLQTLKNAYAPLAGHYQTQDNVPYADWFNAHIQVAETIARSDTLSGAVRLWHGDEGEALSGFLGDLSSHIHITGFGSFYDWCSLFEMLLAQNTLHPKYGAHPRLAILGTFEARLISADLLIMGSLNEKTWPADPAADPWMSRPMRKAFGLPPPEQSIGFSAHDFSLGLAAPSVLLTRSERIDGTPQVQARWLARMDAVLKAHALTISRDCETEHYAKTLDTPQDIKPFPRPVPAPPITLRPRTLSVSGIADLVTDPYAVYAKYILKLRKLPPLEEENDAAMRGSLIHDILLTYVRDHLDDLPEDAYGDLLAYGHQKFETLFSDPAIRVFWWSRFQRMAAWFCDMETQWRQEWRPVLLEQSGAMTLDRPGGHFTVTAKADRIDQHKQTGHYAVIDYKTGQPPKKPAILSGAKPQLPLEALIVEAGGFPSLDPLSVDYLGYWQLSGGAKKGEEARFKPDDIQHMKEAAIDGLHRLIDLYDQPGTPYPSLPNPDMAPPEAFQDYALLARVKEWQYGA